MILHVLKELGIKKTFSRIICDIQNCLMFFMKFFFEFESFIFVSFTINFHNDAPN